MSRVCVSVLLGIVVGGDYGAAISQRARLELNRMKFKGSHLLSSAPKLSPSF